MVDDFETFYRQSKDRCYRALLVLAGNEADDLLAEAYARAWGRWSSLADHPRPEAWVMRTAMNLHRDRRRRERLARRFRRRPDPVPGPELPIDPTVLAALRRLPERQRHVVALRILLDLDTTEAAELLGISPATARVHLHRALGALRRTLTLEPEDLP
ncbi:MAG TPA: sigma-70 family RNA polymerase sigma factor [Actinobacteria bacterium]|nr:sigma-70 family RNA polymerase sigma factor [Actinomycetota bacterium]